MSATPFDLTSLFPDVTFGLNVQVIGLRNVAIGRRSCVGDATWLNVCARDEQVRLRIGNGVLVGRQSMISTGGQLEIGDFCVCAPRVYISDADHVFSDLTRPILAQGATLGRSVVVEENCWLGINAVVTGNLTVGRGSVVAANAVVIEDVPPFSIVAGVPARVIKMYNPLTQQWEKCSDPSDYARIIAARQAIPLPDRDSFRATLHRNAPDFRIDPIVAGRGVHL